jgi:hypothetical protein
MLPPSAYCSANREIWRTFGLVGLTGLAAPEVLACLAGLAGAFCFGAVLLFGAWLHVAGICSVAEPSTWPPEAEEGWPVSALLIALRVEGDTALQPAAPEYRHGAGSIRPREMPARLGQDAAQAGRAAPAPSSDAA